MTPAQIEEAQRFLKELDTAKRELADFQRSVHGDEAKRLDQVHAGRLMFTTQGPGGVTSIMEVKRTGADSAILTAIENAFEQRVAQASAKCRTAGVTL